MLLSDIVCNETLLERYLTVEGKSSSTELQQYLCDVPSDLLQQAEQIFLSQLNISKIFTVSVPLEIKPKIERGKYILIPYSDICWHTQCLHVGRQSLNFVVNTSLVSNQLICICPCQRERLRSNAAEMRLLSQAVSSAAREFTSLINDVCSNLSYVMLF